MFAADGSVSTNRGYSGEHESVTHFLFVTTVGTAVVLADKLSEVLVNVPILYRLESVCLGDK